MKILKGPGIGGTELYFDPKTRGGVLVDPELSPVTIEMKKGWWDPYADPRFRELEVPSAGYDALRTAATDGDKSDVDGILEQHFGIVGPYYAMVMTDRLYDLDVRRIVLADDTAANLDAARAYAETVPGVEFEFYQRGDLLVAAIPDLRERGAGLIVTDRTMKTPDAGLDVLEEGLRNYIPTFVASGGYHHRNDGIIRVSPGRLAIVGDKRQPETWYRIVRGIVDAADDENPQGAVPLIFRYVRTFSAHEAKDPNEWHPGKNARISAKGFFDA